MIVAFRKNVKILLTDKLLQMGLIVENFDLPALETAAFLTVYKACILAVRAFGLYVEIILRISVSDQKSLFAGGDPVKFRAHKSGRSRFFILFFSQSFMKVTHRDFRDAL
jgi:hypothetical protein